MLGEKLKELRKSKKLTQDDIAEMFGVSKGTISNWENGRRKPAIDQIQFLANYYGVSMDFFTIKEVEEEINVDGILFKAANLLNNEEVSTEDKERLYEEIMRLYLKLKEKSDHRPLTKTL